MADPPLTRRSFLAAGGLAAGALVSPGALGQAAAKPAGRTTLRAVRMGSMHVHASFSEGQASMAIGLSQAPGYGLDVVWWTEHDFRMTAGGYREEVRFDGPVEGTGPRRWEWVRQIIGAPALAEASYPLTPHSPDEEGSALRLEARSDGESFAGLRLIGKAWNSTYTTNLADTTLQFDVLEEQLGEDGILFVEIRLSNHPSVGERPAGEYRLRYELGPAADTLVARPDPADPLLGLVPLRPSGNEIGDGWRRFRLRPVDDIATCWPDLLAGDNSLFRLHFGAWARRGATARALVDRLRFYRDRREGDEPLGLQAEFIRHYARQYPHVRQYQSAEISLVRHMNWFGGEFHLPRYPGYYPDGPPVKDGTEEAARRMVAHIHAAGGLAQLNHPLDDAGSSLGAYLVGTRALGCDLVEFGRSPLPEYLAGFDAVARNALFVTATGGNDDHGGSWDRNYPWATSAWAHSAELADLIAALRAGRAWMTDPDRWGGELDLEIRGYSAMGAVVIDAPQSVNVHVVATELPAGGALEIVRGPIDLAGGDAPGSDVKSEFIPAASVARGGVPVKVARGYYVRVAVRDAANEIVGLSNPVWLLGDGLDVDVPSDRELRWRG